MTPGGSAASSAASRPGLQRVLGRWDLAAIGINQTIGGAIFIMPSQVAAVVGGWSPFAFVLGAALTMLVALSLAEVGSRFETTGGPYLYARTAYGRFVAFEVGWMQWFARATSHATVANGLALSVGYYWSGAVAGWGRALVIGGVTALLVVINLLGIKQSARAVNLFTIGKLLPLAVIIAVGLFYVRVERFGPLTPVSVDQATTAALLVIFLFGGYEVLTVPAGEARQPRQQIPFALVTTVVVVGIVTLLGQVVAVGTLDNLAASTTPMADAAATFLGSGGALLISLGAIISMTGNLAGQVLTGSRMLFALGEKGDLPSWFGAIHPRYHTPWTAIFFTATVSVILALSGSFATLAVAAAVARLVPYAASCSAAIVLRHPRFAGQVEQATFLAPGGVIVPLLATLVSLALVVFASPAQLLAGVLALVAGALLYGISRWYAAGRPATQAAGPPGDPAGAPGATTRPGGDPS